jgi:transposase
MKLQALGIDLAKNVFHLAGLDCNGHVVIRKRCSRRQVLAFTANVQVQVIGMEACSGAHFLGRALREQGHEVRLMPAQYVKPYLGGSRRAPAETAMDRAPFFPTARTAKK